MLKEFTCSSCHFQNIHKTAPTRCPICDCGSYRLRFLSKAPREYKGEFVNWTGLEKQNVRVSRALGVHPKQIKEAMKIHPGAEFTPTGDMVIHNRKEKLQRMKERSKHTGVPWGEWD